MNLYNVLLNNKIPFTLLETTDSENVIYCKSFSDYLFNVGTFVTKTKEVILEYVTEGEEKYVIADVTFNDGTCFTGVRFKVIVNEHVETPHSTINLNQLQGGTQVDLPEQPVEIIQEEIEEPTAPPVIRPLIEQADNTEIVRQALETQQRLWEQKQQLSQEKRNLEIEKKKAQAILEKASTLTKEIIEQLQPQLETYKNKIINEFKDSSQKDLNEYVARKLKEDFDIAASIEKKIQSLVEKNSDLETIREDIKKYVDTTISTSVQDAKNYARKILDLGGGGGSVAVQYAKGGTMDGNLFVNNLYPNNNNGEIGSPSNRWDRIYANQIDSLSSNIVVELSGFFVDGDFTVNGTISAIGGNSNQWNSTYNTMQANSAGWESVESTVYANSAKWESNYTTTNNNSASWSSVYTTTNNNSAGWNSNYTTTNSNSALWSNWSTVSASYALGSQYVKLSGDTMTGTLVTPTVSAGAYTVSSNFVIADTGTSRIFSSSDNGKCITFSNTTPVTASVPAGLPVGFNALLLQINTGQVFVSAGPGVTINSDGGKRKIASQHSTASLISYASNTFNLAGNLTT